MNIWRKSKEYLKENFRQKNKRNMRRKFERNQQKYWEKIKEKKRQVWRILKKKLGKYNFYKN